MDSQYAEAYADLHRRHWWFRSREEYLFSLLNRISIPQQANILEIGCGGGWLFDRLTKLGNVEGVEIDGSLIPADGPYADEIYHGPFDREFQPGKQYSLILMLDVLEHIEDPLPALSYALELLAPGGTLLITVPAFLQLWTTHDVLNHHYTRYTQQSFRSLAANVGMRIRRCKYFFHWLFPLKLATRVKECIMTSQPCPPKLPRSPINWKFYNLSRLEQLVFDRACIPFGSSLLVVGGKDDTEGR